MTTPISNQSRQFNPIRYTAVRLGWLAMVISLIQLTAAGPVAAENPPGNAGHRVYLPLVIKSDSQSAPASPYAQILTDVLERCQTINFNQVCYGHGQIQGADGQEFIQPGDMANLATGQNLTVTSSDSEHWSVALLRLRANSDTPDQSLTLLAFGNVQVSNIALFEAGKNDEASLPGLRFASRPVPGTPEGASGLLVYNPSGDEFLSIALNGATVTLETSAFSQAEPGQAMSVTMVNGSVLIVEAGDGNSAVIPGHQVSVPLSADGSAGDAPGVALPLGNDPLAALRYSASTQQFSASAGHPMVEVMLKMIPEYFTDSKAHAFYNDLANIYETNINTVFNRCVTAPADARSVYGLMVLNRMLRSSQNLEPAFGEARFAQLAAKMHRCATFELEFDSQIDFMGANLSYSSHVNSQGYQLHFKLNGDLDFEDDQIVPIKHLAYNVSGGEVPGCTMHTITEDGQLFLQDASLTMRGSKLRLRLDLWPEVPFEQIYYTCPSAPPTESIPLAWSPLFYLFHRDKLRSQAPPSFSFNDWKYNGRKNFAEAIYTDLTADYEGAAITSASYLILIHTPQK